MPGAYSLELSDNAAAFEAARDQAAEGRGVVQRAAVYDVVDISDQQMVGEIAGLANRLAARQIVCGMHRRSTYNR